MKKIVITLMVLFAILLTGCGPSQLQIDAADRAARRGAEEAEKQEKRRQADERQAMFREQAKTADCGPLPKNWQELVKKAIANKLKDPSSAKFDFEGAISSGKIGKDFIEKSNGEVLFHWSGFVRVNAKNGLGGYVGFRNWHYRIHGTRVFDLFDMGVL